MTRAESREMKRKIKKDILTAYKFAFKTQVNYSSTSCRFVPVRTDS